MQAELDRNWNIENDNRLYRFHRSSGGLLMIEPCFVREYGYSIKTCYKALYGPLGDSVVVGTFSTIKEAEKALMDFESGEE